MDSNFKELITTLLDEPINSIYSLSGGDISQAYKIETPKNNYFLKLNSNPRAIEMFQAETYGLEYIEKTNTFKTPKVIVCDTIESSAFILMEFIESKSPSISDFETLGTHLAQLHKNTSENFGLSQDNFIGSLPQSNSEHNTWIDFYTQERLLPQLNLANQTQLLSDKECPTKNRINYTLNSFFCDIKPSLLHGDLWSGNYLISKDGVPYLVDPAIYYGHNEVDIAMSKLFGGFGSSFYEAYQNNFSFNEHTNARIEIYQLYYLLVHLNLFGSTYYNSVKSILNKYF